MDFSLYFIKIDINSVKKLRKRVVYLLGIEYNNDTA